MSRTTQRPRLSAAAHAFPGAYLVLALAAAVTAAGPVAAQARADRPGAQDPPFLKRYAGSVITEYEAREFAEVRLVERAAIHADRDVRNERNSRAVEGRHVRVLYNGPAGRSALEVYRNYEAALRAAGFASAFTCDGARCGDSEGRELRNAVGSELQQALGRGIFRSNPTDVRYGLFRLARPAGDTWVAVLVQHAANHPPEIFVETVEARPMETGRVAVLEVTSIAADLERQGHVALYGILFATDQAVPLPDSVPQLEQLASYLRADAGTQVLVVGHTDNVGALDYNRELSQRRAQAVVDALVERGIAAARLTPVGVGMAAPLASNATEAGRAQNRRVEVVQR